MTVVAAASVAPEVFRRMHGARITGVGRGHGYAELDDGYVLAVTSPGRPRLPNGVEAAVQIALGQAIDVGNGRLLVGETSIEPGPIWNPVPALAWRVAITPSFEINIDALVGRGDGLTPVGDDVIVGYLAGLTLSRPTQGLAAAVLDRVGARTTSLSTTLLRHAAVGELPEPFHGLLTEGRLEPLLGLGSTSGSAMAVGFGAADRALSPGPVVRSWSVTVPIPLGPTSFRLDVSRLDAPAHARCTRERTK